MIRRNTWIVLAVFIILMGITVYLQKSDKLTFVTEETPSPTQAALFGLDTGDITSLTIESKDGLQMVVSKQTDDSWAVTEPAGSQVESATISAAVSGITSWKVMNDLSAAPSVESIGLSNPTYVITMTMSGGQKRTLEIGDRTPTEAGYYIQIDGSTPVVVSSYSIETVLNLFTTITSTPTPAATETMSAVTPTVDTEALATPTVETSTSTTPTTDTGTSAPSTIETGTPAPTVTP